MDEKRLLETFTDLARIHAPSGHEGEAAAYCAEALRACGCTVEFDRAGEEVGSDTGNLYAVLPGTAEGSVVLTAHLDCVEPCEGVSPRVEGGVIRSDGTTILGADDKVGVASIVEAVRTLSESEEPHARVKVVFSIQEELGCIGAGHLGVGEFEPGEPCYVFDGEGAPGAICLAAPFHYTFEASFAGKASHAGVAPDKGVSAIEAASIAIERMKERGLLGRVGEYCAANIGSIEGGGATNVVPDSCTVTGECRAIDEGAVNRVHDGMAAALHEGAEAVGATVDVAWDLAYKGFCLSEDDRAVVLFRQAAERLGLPFSVEKSAGGTDANHYVKHGMSPVVVSTGMTNFHSVEECLAVRDLEDTARLAVELARVAAL